jgi:transcriptional regulator with XRE-family HTH domain
MRFNTYLKQCREHIDLTQEQLSYKLYAFDDEKFKGILTTTISKWERGTTQPQVAKQVAILKYLQKQTGDAFPCLEGRSIEETEAMICRAGLKNLIIGTPRKIVLDFPSKFMRYEYITVAQIKHRDRIDALLDIAADMKNSENPPFTQIDLEKMKEWALHPNNLFLTCQYKEINTGLLFSLRLKPPVFDAVIRFEKKIYDVKTDDFASYNEPGSHFLLFFFGLNHRSATMLFIRYYAHLIANQNAIEEVGSTLHNNDAKKIIRNMNLRLASTYKDGESTIYSYRNNLFNLLASENVIKMLFAKQDHPS